MVEEGMVPGTDLLGDDVARFTRDGRVTAHARISGHPPLRQRQAIVMGRPGPQSTNITLS
jgi:hypothetical protein